MTSTALRRTLALCGLTAVVLTAALWHAPTAGAHPLGNFTVNHYNGLRLYTDRLDNTAIVDRAEIAAAQEFPDVDTDHDDTTSPPERRAHARKSCSALARNLYAAVDGSRLHWRVRSSEFTYEPGEAGLPTSRLHCELTAPASLDRPAALTVKDRYDDERLGWHELTARGHGVTLHSSPVRATSVTDELRCYPDEQLAAPLDQRALTLRTTPGTGRPGSAAHTTGPTPGIAGGALPIPLLDRVTGAFTSLVGARELTVPVGLLALLLSVVLGASHAAMPGHGKTIMAAYLVGRRGNVRDAITVGATVTFTHTAGVLMLGLLLPLTTTLAGETALTYLGLASGALVTAIGIGLLRDALRTRRTGHHHHHHHHPGHHHHSHEAHGHASGHAHDHADGHGPTAPPVRGTSRRGLVGMGIAGGLVPSPSALVVLLGSVALGRTAFGILLVLGYGIGMAATLMAAGIALTHLRDRFGHGVHGRLARSKSLITRATRYGPTLTATLVLTVGVGLTLRATSGPW